MTISIARRVLDEIHLHAESSYPEECCGLLVSDQSRRVTESVKMNNTYRGSKHNRYNIEPLDLFRVDRAMAQRGMLITGVYHSHPDYPATLSKFDVQHSFPWYSYLVVSVSAGRSGDTRAWSPREDHTSASEEPIEVFW